MKKIKKMLIFAVMLISICACGEKGDVDKSVKTEEKVKDVTNLEQIVQEELEQENDVIEENVTEEEVLNLPDEKYECLPDMLDASLDECLIQIDKTIIRDDHTMTLSEVIEAFQNSGVEYTFEVDSVEYNPEMLIGGRGYLYVDVLKNGELYFNFSVENRSTETVSAKSDTVIFDTIIYTSPTFLQNCYFAKGIRADGEGQTYETVKALLADYSSYIVERNQNVQAIDGEYYQGIEMKLEWNKGDLYISTTIRFKATDGACIGMFFHTSYFEL